MKQYLSDILTLCYLYVSLSDPVYISFQGQENALVYDVDMDKAKWRIEKDFDEFDNLEALFSSLLVKFHIMQPSSPYLKDHLLFDGEPLDDSGALKMAVVRILSNTLRQISGVETVDYSETYNDWHICTNSSPSYGAVDFQFDPSFRYSAYSPPRYHSHRRGEAITGPAGSGTIGLIFQASQPDNEGFGDLQGVHHYATTALHVLWTKSFSNKEAESKAWTKVMEENVFDINQFGLKDGLRQELVLQSQLSLLSTYSNSSAGYIL